MVIEWHTYTPHAALTDLSLPYDMRRFVPLRTTHTPTICLLLILSQLIQIEAFTNTRRGTRSISGPSKANKIERKCIILHASPSRIRKKLKQEDDATTAEATPKKTEKIKSKSNTLGNENEFSNFKIHPLTFKAINEVLNFQKLTEIQQKTLTLLNNSNKISNSGDDDNEVDILARAQTGTGKTLAYLIPAIESVLQSKEHARPGVNIGVLIISPTRELAVQIADTADKLLTFHRDMSVQCIVGGTSIGRDKALLSQRIPTVLVATPGRVQDHLSETKIAGRKFADIVAKTRVLVLDETDRLLEMGFRRDVLRIVSHVSHKRRRTMLFSATLPKKMRSVMSETMKPGFTTIDCVNDGNSISVTSQKIKQRFLILPSFDNLVQNVVDIIADAASSENKVIVFFPTARMVGFFAQAFDFIYATSHHLNVIQMHSRKSQGHRTRTSKEFRSSKGGIVLFTSDVSARGLDYPDITHVIQFGMPDGRESYIHRLGRTGRIGKDGEGLLVLFPFERSFLEEIKDVCVSEHQGLNRLIEKGSSAVDRKSEEMVSVLINRIRSGDLIFTPSAEMAYQAFLGYYSSPKNMKRIGLKSQEDLVRTANTFAEHIGLVHVPRLSNSVVCKMGLKGVRGIEIAGEDDE